MGVSRVRRARAALIGLAIAAGLLLLEAHAALANTYRPTRFDDPTPDGCAAHDCSLREAIIKANHHPGADKVVLKGGRTYALSIPARYPDDDETNGDLNLTDNVRLISSTHRRATIDGNAIDDVIYSGTPGPVHAALTRVRIRDGLVGILLVEGSLALSRSVVSGNDSPITGGGIITSPGTSLTVSRSTVSGNHANPNGGGLAINGSATITKSTIRGNTASGDAGGGVLVEDHSAGVTVKDSTISENHANGQGGGISVDSRRIKLVNDTLAGNSADTSGGAIFDGGTVAMNAVTVAYNRADADGNGTGFGGGLYVDSSAIGFTVENSLVARNSAGLGSGPDCGSSINQFTSGGHNLIGTTAGCTGFGPPVDHGDIVNPASSRIRIGKLAGNGGPTKTIALKRGSKAIDHAGRGAPDRDQRGKKRDKHPDIGAFERR